MKINNIKVMAATIAFVSCGLSFSVCKDNLKAHYNEESGIITRTNADMMDTTEELVVITEPVTDATEESIVITEPTTDATEESIVITEPTTDATEESIVITEPTTIEETTINPYEDIMFLYDIDSSISLEDLSLFINKYSTYSKVSYDDAICILSNNIDSFDTYSSLRGYIMCTLFNYSSDCGLLSSTCSSSIVEHADLTLEDKESVMIEMCDSLGLSNTDKTIILAIFRHETGNGTSKRCCCDNNYGGIKVGDSFGVYQTPYYGMYKAIMCIDGHINRNKEKLGTTDLYSIVSGMSYSYCPGTASDWTNKIISFCNDVSSDYNDFSDSIQYTK